ncbi:hypothetical protein BH09ACT10_BH09ACT10_30290 [soil metagenome]
MSTSKELPELTDARIEAMRRTIMRGVRVDSERRRKRGRMLLGAAAAVVAVGIGSSVIASLPSSNDSGGDSASAGSAASDSGGEIYDAKPTGPDPQSGEGRLAAGDSPADTGCASCSTSGREVITTGSITLTVAKPQEAAQKISDLVESLGGRTDQRSESGAKGNDDAQAHLTIRVPSAKVNQTIDKLDAFGTVENVSIDNTDVTTQGRDLDARIGALQISVNRLEEFMRTAKSSSDLLKAESALTKRQAELESLLSERKGLSDQVALSSFEVELNAKTTPDAVSSGGFSGAFVDGWNGLVSTINAIVVAVGFLIPWLVVGAILAAIGLVVMRRRQA